MQTILVSICRRKTEGRVEMIADFFSHIVNYCSFYNTICLEREIYFLWKEDIYCNISLKLQRTMNDGQFTELFQRI